MAALSAIDRTFAGKYLVGRILGQGGMGVVFEARHLRLGQRVAIKVLGTALREFPELVQRFEREARAAGSLSSIHAVRIFDIDAAADGTPFIVMELLNGRDLGHIVEDDGPQPIARAVGWVLEACEAIAEAHRLGIVHRDIKPSNLFLSESGAGERVVKVLDFGIAKQIASTERAITQALAPLGTPQYMSPEQVRCAKNVDARTDIWSLGVTLYELLTGRTPFAHESSSACIAAIAADPVPDPRTLCPELPDALAKVLMRALAKCAAERYASVDELVDALRPFARPASDVHDVREDPPRADGAEPVREDTVSAVRRIAIPASPPPSMPRPCRSAAVAFALPTGPARRRRRSALAIGSAAVLGLAALVLTPRCVATAERDQPSVASASETAAGARVELLAAHLAPAAPAAAAGVALPVAEPTIEEPAPGVGKPSRPTRGASLTAAAPVEAKVKSSVRGKVERPPPKILTASRGPVHGGLSSPGF